MYFLSSWFLVLASVDRYCLSSRHVYLRTYSCMSIAGRSIFISSILDLFQIESISLRSYCYAQTGIYRIFYDILFSSSFRFVPPILMMIIGLATLGHVRSARQRIRAT